MHWVHLSRPGSWVMSSPSSEPPKLSLYLLRYTIHTCRSRFPQIVFSSPCRALSGITRSIDGSSLTAHDFIAKCIFCGMSLARTCRPRKFEHTTHKLPIDHGSPISSLLSSFRLCVGASAYFSFSLFRVPEHKHRALRQNS